MSSKKNYRKYAATTMAAAVVATGVAPFAASAETNYFADVTPELVGDHYDSIMALTAKDIIRGHEDGLFRPEAAINREQVAILFQREMGLEIPENIEEVLSVYPDVNYDVASDEAVEAIAAVTEAGIFSGKEDGTFDPKGSITRQQIASVLVRAYDLNDYNVGENVDINLDGVGASHADNVQVIANLGVTNQVDEFGATKDLPRKQYATFLYRTLNVVEAGIPVVDVEVESVSAINTKTLAVAFNAPVQNTAAAEFTIKKGASTLSADVTWNADKTEAHLELAGKVTAGTYDVSVAGLTEEALTGSVETQNETVADVKVLTTEAPLNVNNEEDANDNTIKVAYQLLNQYGEDVTKSSLGASLEVTPTKGTVSTIVSADRGTLTLTGNYEVDDKVTVVIVDENTGKSASGVVNVVDSSVLDTVELGEVYNAKELELTEDNRAGQYVLLSGLDQYGNDFDIEPGNVTIVSSNKEVADFSVDTVEIDEEDVTALAIDVKKAGTTTLTVVSNSTGKTVTKEITVAPGIKTDTIVIGDAEGTVSGDKEILLPVEITNNKGELVTKAVDANSKVGLQVTEDIPAKFVEKDGALYIELTTPSVDLEQQETIVVTARTETNNVVTKVLTVSPDAVATELVGVDNSVTFNILAGHVLEIPKSKFIVNDQYGDRITDTNKYEIDAELNAEESTFEESVDGEGKITIQSTANSKNETITFNLVGANPESTIEQKLTVVNASEFASYEVEDVDVIYAAEDVDVDGEGTGVYRVANEDYNEDIVVKATTDTGKVVTLKQGDYNVEGKPAVGDVVKFAEDATTATVPVTITINATGETLTKQLTYSNVAPKVTEFFFTSTTFDGELKDAKALEGVQDVEAATFAATEFTDVAKIVTTDQYGVQNYASDLDVTPRYTFVPEKVADVTITGNGQADATVTLKDEVEESIVTVRVTIGDVTEDIQVKLTASEEAPEPTPTEADNFEAIISEVEATVDTEVTAGELEAAITNLPIDATTDAAAFIPTEEGSETQDVTITFEDGSTKVVTVTVNVAP